MILRDGSQIVSSIGDNTVGEGGDIAINARRLSIQTTLPVNFLDLATLQTSSDVAAGATGIATEVEPGARGQGGDLVVNASESVELIGNQPGPFNPASPLPEI